jgi:hypothetical protein
MVQSTIKRDIYKDYIREMENIYKLEKIVSEKQFLEVWRVLYPHCQIRAYCSIRGKCHECADFDYLKRIHSDPEARRGVRDLRLLHRCGKFMRERAAYMRRKKYALENPDRVMSLIIDKMDQNHCTVPYLGTQVEYSDSLKIGQ